MPSSDRDVAPQNSGSDQGSATRSARRHPSSERARLLRILGSIFLGLFLALVAIPTPRVPTEADQDTTADASWSAVLGFSHQHGLQFGTDIVFTYGPLGFLTTPFTADDQIGLRLITDGLLGLVTAAGIVLLAGRMPFAWSWLLVAAAVFLFGNIYPRSDLLIEAALVCWGLLTLLESKYQLRIAAPMLIAIAALAALVKITLLIIAVLTVGWISLDFLLRRKHTPALGMAAGFGALFLLGWMALGQNLSHLGTFLSRAVSTSQGYNLAMGYEGSPELRWRGVFTVLAAAAAVLIRSATALEGSRVAVRRLLLSAWFSAVLFLVWKHGFVRTDLYHAGFYFGLLPILVLALEALTTDQTASRIWSQVVAILCAFVCLVTVQSIVLPGDLKFSLRQPFTSAIQNVGRFLRPAQHRQEVAAARAGQSDRSQLPQTRRIINRSSVDMFGCDQTSLLCNELNYHPRPVFQSYAAYNAPLMDLNEQFYLSPTAPDYVLFSLVALDRKFPPLEDARTLRHLLINYEPAGTEGQFLVLKGRARTKAKLQLVREGSAQIGQRISLDELSDADLWMELDLQPTLAGRVRDFFYQPAKTRLALWYGSAGKPTFRRFRAPSPMLAAGFLLSPLLFNNDDVLHLYEGKEVKRPSACALEVNPGSEPLWQPRIAFRIYRVESKLGRSVPPGSNDPGPL